MTSTATTLPDAPPAPTPVEETPLEALASISTVIVIAMFVFSFIFQNFEIPSASMEKTLLIGDHVVVDRSTLAPATRWAPFVHYRDVQRGDIIVFMKPHPESPDLILVKRCIGLPGDRIHLRHGVVYLNGVAQNEPYAIQPTDSAAYPADYDPTNDEAPEPYVPSRDDFPSDVAGIQRDAIANNAALWAEDLPSHIEGDDLVVPPGTVFAMGDNRTHSLDGRYWGFVPRQNILGRPMFVYWSFKTPADQENKTSFGERIGFIFHIVIHIFDGTRWSRTFHVIR